MATSSSSSYSFPGDSSWETLLSQIISGMGQQTFNWAQGVYQKTSAMTDQLINQFQQQAQTAVGDSSQLMNQYVSQISPEITSLVNDANTYASPARVQQNMGAAESATGQAANQGRINAEQNLRSFGIDPSAGRYQELEQAQRAGAAAAQAGAGQEAQLATEATGRQLRSEAIQAGQQLPGQAVNFLNTAVGATQGASQANLGNAQVGAQLMDTAAPYMNSAMNMRYAPNLTRSSSSSDSGGGGGGGGGGYGGGGGSDQNSSGSYGGSGSDAYGGFGPGAYGADTSYMGGNTDNGATYDTSGDSGYAAGGGVLPQPLPQGNGATTGGHVPVEASPSLGKNTDDVNARLNADEFVIPRDVAHWKGQEFFQKLIDESRRKRLGAPAKGKPKPPLGGPPRFTSQHMGAQ